MFFDTVKDIYKNNKTISIEIFTSSFFLSHDATLSVNNSVLFFLTQAVESSEDSDESFVFTGGNKNRNVIPETQLEFDDQDIVLSGNVDGIGNIQTFTIPETQKM